MLVAFMHLAVADFGDDDEDIGMRYLWLGFYLYQQERRAKSHNTVGRRYGHRGPYIKNRTQEFIDKLINTATDRFFKNWFRVDRDSFNTLLDLIKDDPVFVNRRGPRPQAPVKYQLGVYLIRYGNVQNVKTATLLQMSEGSMYNYCRRVTKAFRNLRNLYVKWPTSDERRRIKLKAQ
ncbi:hypothetical protein FRC08_001788 [Ceratobasidium sp. 394]|nr:hypothetical protein FRC08_001788 [Ceratobasidium sp. 394]